jgi:hypothetical protein
LGCGKVAQGRHIARMLAIVAGGSYGQRDRAAIVWADHRACAVGHARESAGHHQQVHDGDTVVSLLEGNVGIRFLGVDAPEVSFTFPGRKGFIRLTDPAWEAFLPFELRYLARRTAPERWVIDLGGNDDTLIPPQGYFQVANPEDRLFVPAEYVPLFVEAGWQRPD